MLAAGPAQPSGSAVETSTDEYGYAWIILRDEDFEDLVVAINTVSSSLEGGGYGDRLLAAVFAFEEEGRPIYFIYNFKRGSFYPFVPAGSKQVPVCVEVSGHGRQSTKSFTPAARTSGFPASTATAGSFWWFRGVEPLGLPLVTRELAPAPAGKPSPPPRPAYARVIHPFARTPRATPRAWEARAIRRSASGPPRARERIHDRVRDCIRRRRRRAPSTPNHSRSLSITRRTRANGKPK